MRFRPSTTGAIRPRAILSLILLALLPLLAWAATPTWWTARGVLKSGATTDDYAAANQGQVRNIAKQAYEELKARLPGGAGAELDAIWSAPKTSSDDYRTVNLGQLKNLAKPFYARLIALGYTTFYPWQVSTKPADDYALVNLGQVKNLFAFDVVAGVGHALPDSDGDGFGDDWELKYFGHLGVDPKADSDGDGLTNLQEYQLGRNPTEAAISDTNNIIGLQLFQPHN